MNILKVALLGLMFVVFSSTFSEGTSPTPNTKLSQSDYFQIARKYYAYEGEVSKKAEKSLKALAHSDFNLNVVDKKGETILHRAAHTAPISVQEALIKFGVNPLIKNNMGETAKDIIHKRKQKERFEQIMPAVLILITLLGIFLSFWFSHKIKDPIYNIGKSWFVRIPYALFSGFAIGVLIAIIVGSNGNQFEGGKGLGVLYLSFLTVPVSFFILLGIKNPAIQLILVMFSTAVIYTHFLYS